MAPDKPSAGLEGVVAATTQLSEVDGERGELNDCWLPRRRAGRARHIRSRPCGCSGTERNPRRRNSRTSARSWRPTANCRMQRPASCARPAVAGLDSMDALRIATGAHLARLSRRDPSCRHDADNGGGVLAVAARRGAAGAASSSRTRGKLSLHAHRRPCRTRSASARSRPISTRSLTTA